MSVGAKGASMLSGLPGSGRFQKGQPSKTPFEKLPRRSAYIFSRNSGSIRAVTDSRTVSIHISVSGCTLQVPYLGQECQGVFWKKIKYQQLKFDIRYVIIISV